LEIGCYADVLFSIAEMLDLNVRSIS